MSIVKIFKDSLPKYLHTMPRKGEALIWLPRDKALGNERFKTYLNDRRFMMCDYDVSETTPAVDHTHYDIEPNFVIYNPVSESHQAYWLLADAVHCQKQSKQNPPFQFLRAIERAYDEKYNCDKHFVRYISRNPLFAAADTDWRHDRAYKLSELAEVVELNKRRVVAGNKAIKCDGRNCTVFDDLRYWAYTQDTSHQTREQWFQRCLTQAIEYNKFKVPLDIKEVTTIARSVSNYTYSRTFSETFEQYVTRTHTSEIQAIRGAIGGKKSKRQPMSDSETTRKPWTAMGISRSTYYRRKKTKIGLDKPISVDPLLGQSNLLDFL